MIDYFINLRSGRKRPRLADSAGGCAAAVVQTEVLAYLDGLSTAKRARGTGVESSPKGERSIESVPKCEWKDVCETVKKALMSAHVPLLEVCRFVPSVSFLFILRNTV
jgi:hypothetical protein